MRVFIAKRSTLTGFKDLLMKIDRDWDLKIGNCDVYRQAKRARVQAKLSIKSNHVINQSGYTNIA